MSVGRTLRTALKSATVQMFHLGQRVGVDFLPRHFYSEIPDVARLTRTTAWREPFTFAGVAGANVDEQLAFVRTTVPDAMKARLSGADVYAPACEANGAEGFGPVEAMFLHAFVATHRPARILQVGCGVSTAVCLNAARESSYPLALTAVDPFPTTFLREQAAQKHIELIDTPVEDLSPDLLTTLSAGDLFFIDSTHTLGPAGEVTRLVLEWLPRVPAGVHVHFHDIYFPYDYPGETLTTALFFPHESALVHAVLVGNASLKISASLSMLHHARARELAERLPGYAPRPSDKGLAIGPGHFPSSLYLQTSL